MLGKSTSLSVLLLSSLCLAAACGSSAPATGSKTISSGAQPADLVLVGGVLITGDPAPGRARATALAVRGERIVYVGDDAGARALAGPKTRVIELAGRGVSAGLVDAHCHLAGLGAALEMLDLRGSATPEAVAEAVAKIAAQRPAGEWITGRGWDQTLWPGKQFPHHAVLDAVSANHPVSVRRVDGHALWANAAALKLAGVSAETKAPAGGQILRDGAGQPTGVFVDNAMSLIEGHIPRAGAEVIERRIRKASQLAVSLGMTGVHEMGISDTTIAVYRKLAASGELPLRVYGFLQGDMDVIARLGERPGPELKAEANAYFVLRGIKLYADGALGSRGAALLAPYSDQDGHTGNWVHTAAEISLMVEKAVATGWQLGIHAIGDAGNRAALDAYERALAGRKGADLRLRIEHAQVVSPADLPRFAKLGVIASMQPTHATSDMRWAEARLGPKRVRGAYAWRTLLESGAHLASGSDFPVEKPSPMLGLHAAVTRQAADGTPEAGWYPEQRMSLDEAVASFTRAAAYASFSETDRGMLRDGYLADITVYDQALVGDATLLSVQTDLTILGGRVRYERSK